jgi:DNA-directed RNA polymerase beta subunit
MPFEGFNFEDAIVGLERVVKDDILTSIHIHEYEIDARARRSSATEITRDIPNRPRSRCRSSTSGVAHRRRGRRRRPARGQGHEGRTS